MPRWRRSTPISIHCAAAPPAKAGRSAVMCIAAKCWPCSLLCRASSASPVSAFKARTTTNRAAATYPCARTACLRPARIAWPSPVRRRYASSIGVIRMTAPELLLPEDPLDRLNYFNSQRLEAIDFRLEQAYHMRVRRWINRSLYSAGVGAGLEVTAHPVDKHAVVVSPGLALDWLGREVILLNERKIMACGTPRRADGVTFGNYLVIAYREEKVAPQSDGCRVQGVYDSGLDACGCKRSA